MQTLLTAIVMWLSFNLGLPATYDHPQIERLSSVRMAALRLEAASSGSSANSGENIVALYDNRTRTIYLRNDWTGATPAELSVLVHEMVHHLQNVAGSKYDYAEACEKLAYEAQKSGSRCSVTT